jgi:endonuclease III
VDRVVVPRERLLQHDHGGNDRWTPWRVLVVTQLCQRTTGTQVCRALDGFFERWPTPHALASANTELEKQLKPAGFVKTRAGRLREMSSRYASWIDDLPLEGGTLAPPVRYPPAPIVRGWPGVGKYTEEAYRLIVEGDLSFEPEDKELVRFWAFKTSS